MSAMIGLLAVEAAFLTAFTGVISISVGTSGARDAPAPWPGKSHLVDAEPERDGACWINQDAGVPRSAVSWCSNL